MSKAIYFPNHDRSVEFDVHSKNDDGTVNLYFEGNPVVTSCRITATPEVGACVMKGEEDPNQPELAITKTPTATAGSTEPTAPTLPPKPTAGKKSAKAK